MFFFLSLYFSIEISTFSLLFYWNLHFSFSLLFYWNLYCLFAFLLKPLQSLYFSFEICFFFFLIFYWNLHLFFYFPIYIEISTFSIFLFYWNFYFSLHLLYFSFEISSFSLLSIEISTFFLLFFWNQYTFSLLSLEISTFFSFLLKSLLFVFPLHTGLQPTLAFPHNTPYTKKNTAAAIHSTGAAQRPLHTASQTTFSTVRLEYFLWNRSDLHRALLSNFHTVPRLPHKLQPLWLGYPLDWAIQLWATSWWLYLFTELSISS